MRLHCFAWNSRWALNKKVLFESEYIRVKLTFFFPFLIHQSSSTNICTQYFNFLSTACQLISTSDNGTFLPNIDGFIYNFFLLVKCAQFQWYYIKCARVLLCLSNDGNGIVMIFVTSYIVLICDWNQCDAHKYINGVLCTMQSMVISVVKNVSYPEVKASTVPLFAFIAKLMQVFCFPQCDCESVFFFFFFFHCCVCCCCCSFTREI